MMLSIIKLNSVNLEDLERYFISLPKAILSFDFYIMLVSIATLGVSMWWTLSRLYRTQLRLRTMAQVKNREKSEIGLKRLRFLKATLEYQ